jgi:hypothetical protein
MSLRYHKPIYLGDLLPDEVLELAEDDDDVVSTSSRDSRSSSGSSWGSDTYWLKGKNLLPAHVGHQFTANDGSRGTLLLSKISIGKKISTVVVYRQTHDLFGMLLSEPRFWYLDSNGDMIRGSPEGEPKTCVQIVGVNKDYITTNFVVWMNGDRRVCFVLGKWFDHWGW